MEVTTPSTITVRRNPHRRARPTPASTLPFPPQSTTTPKKITSFPIQDILDIQIQENQEPPSNSTSSSSIPTTNQNPQENLKVFLRIRPPTIQSKDRNVQNKNVWPKNPKLKNPIKQKARKIGNLCIAVNDAHSITISPPEQLQDSKRVKSEVYDGFSHVFASESNQVEVYEKLLKPLVDDFLKGKSGMLAAVGPSGSGKTHTMFGCVREPGMVPLALGEIFSEHERKLEEEPRTIYMSMFEISSEKGKSERISDLLQGGHDLPMQNSTVKGVQQVKIHSVHQAEGLLACGLLKRATAGTNTNSQSSRSQCIINFRRATSEVDDQADYGELTIVDLAGAEREKRTGNQGTRLLESNFINNTSMVFGLCLRALLEHQKNPKRQLQKHFQNSMLTRFLRDYLEGKKRMSLILTVKPSEEDYLDTSFVLRQAAPYMQIKFSNVEQANNLTYKRPLQTLNRKEPLKRRKCTGLGDSETTDEKILGDPQIIEEGHAIGSVVEGADLIETSITEESLPTFTEADKNYKVLEGLSKAIWKVLKEYNTKLKEAQKENCILSAELAKERKRCLDLESLINDVRFKCSCRKESSESNINDNGNVQKPSSISSRMEGSRRNSIEHAHYHFEKSPSACVPSRVMVEISKRCSPQQDGTSSKNVNFRPNNEASERLTDPGLQSYKGLDKTTESYSSGESRNHSIDKLEAVVNCSDEETCISSVSDVLPLTNFNGSGDSEKSPSVCVPSQVMVEISKRCSPQQDGTSSKNVNYRPNNEASERPLGSCLQSSEGLDKATESYRSGKIRSHSIDKLKAVAYCSDEEACISSVSDVLPVTNFNDSGDSEKSPSACVLSRFMVEISKQCSPQQDGTISKDVDYRPSNEASERPTDSCLQSCEGLDKTTESYSNGENTNCSIDELKAVVYCSDEEACISSASDVLPHESGDSEYVINVTDVRREYIHHNDDNLTTEDTTDLEIKEIADSATPSSDFNAENLSLPKQHLICSPKLELVLNSSQFPNSTTDRSLVTKDEQLEKVKQIHERMCSQECDVNNVSMVAGISTLPKESQNVSKPKRRLLPVSSLLLKDMSSLATEDETNKRKGGVSFDEKIKPHSKTSLLQLLHRNVVG